MFTNHSIHTLSTGNSIQDGCLACQIKTYSQTDVLVGLHGAGMTNMVFMPPGSLVVEIVGKFDGRMLPLCGYHSSLAAMYGHHHFLYYYDWKDTQEAINALDIAQQVVNFYHSLVKT